MADSENTLTLPKSRDALEHLIEAAIARLDELDGDPDLEPSLGSAEARYDNFYHQVGQLRWAAGGRDDRELDDEREPEDLASGLPWGPCGPVTFGRRS